MREGWISGIERPKPTPFLRQIHVAKFRHEYKSKTNGFSISFTNFGSFLDYLIACTARLRRCESSRLVGADQTPRNSGGYAFQIARSTNFGNSEKKTQFAKDSKVKVSFPITIHFLVVIS